MFPQIGSLAVRATLSALGVDDPWIKWPNDVYVGHAKIAGLLCEFAPMECQTETLVMGIGINVNMPPKTIAKIDQPATSVFVETHQQHRLDELLSILTMQLNRYYSIAVEEGAMAVYRLWADGSGLVNRAVVVTDGAGIQLHGRVIGLNPDGSLEMILASGETRRFINGDVSLRYDDKR